MLAAYREFLGGYPTLPLSDAVMETFARQRARLRHQGQLIPDVDLAIAATALEHGLTVVTRNPADYDDLPELALCQPS